jgi:hypothetical protein
MVNRLLSFRNTMFQLFRNWNLVFFSIGVCLGGCADTQQAKSVHTSGFLGDYSLLQKGQEGEALLTYRNPQADFSKYQKVYVDPIAVWQSPDSDLNTVSKQDLRHLADDLRSKIIWQLKQDYLVVPSPASRVMRIQVALTEAQKSNVAMDITSTLIPGSGLLTRPHRMASGTQAFVGRASIEGKIIDAESEEILFAAVDRREGGKTLDGSMDSWGDVKQSFQDWANRLRYRLCTLRGKSSCEKPAG